MRGWGGDNLSEISQECVATHFSGSVHGLLMFLLGLPNTGGVNRKFKNRKFSSVSVSC